MEPIIIKKNGKEKKNEVWSWIDISKGKSTIAILSIAGEVIEKPFEINHDIDGLNLLEEKLKDISKEELKIKMEETGTYHLPLLGYLLKEIL